MRVNAGGRVETLGGVGCGWRRRWSESGWKGQENGGGRGKGEANSSQGRCHGAKEMWVEDVKGKKQKGDKSSRKGFVKAF